MTFRPAETAFGPPFRVKVPSFLYALVALGAVTTVLLAEQMAAMALNVSARGYVLRRGQVVHEGPTADLVNSGLIAALSSAYL